MAEKRGGHREQLLVSILVVDDDGLVVDVAGRHDEQGNVTISPSHWHTGTSHCHTGEVVEQEVLEGGVGQHDAQCGQAVGQPRRKGGVRALLQQHDGALRALERGGLGVAHLADAAHVVRRGGHHRERLALAALAGAQERHGIGVVRVAHQVEAAEALNGQDLPRAQQLHGACEDGIALRARAAPGHLTERRGDGIGGAQCFT